MEGGNHGIQVKIKVMRKVRGCREWAGEGWRACRERAESRRKQVGNLLCPFLFLTVQVFTDVKVLSWFCSTKGCFFGKCGGLVFDTGASLEQQEASYG